MLPVGINAKHVGAGSVFVFVHGRVLSGQVITEVHFWPENNGLLQQRDRPTWQGGSSFMQLSVRYLHLWGFFVFNTVFNDESYTRTLPPTAHKNARCVVCTAV